MVSPVIRNSYNENNPGPEYGYSLSGDWDGDGLGDIGVLRPSTHMFYLDYNGNGALNGAVTDRSYNFGITGDSPVAGAW